jgi:hypothetical protein
MLTYVGKGYTPGFTVNYDRVAARLNKGEDIEIVNGPDEICAPLLDDPDAHCRGDSVVMRDKAALDAVTTIPGLELAIGSRFTLSPNILELLRAEFSQGTIRAACSSCEWSNLCDSVASSGFCGVKIDAARSERITLSP